MARIFHQNMRVFGGGAAGRNAAYNAAFGAIQAATGPDYIVAGFTEVTNPHLPLRVQLSALAQTLSPGLAGFVVIGVGTTALGMTEYVGIAWDPANVVVDHAGHVLWDSMAKGWRPHNTPVPAAGIPNDQILLPAGVPFGADSRGLAYVAGMWGGSNLIFGFMHNMYNLGDRSSAFSSLSRMADRLRQTIGGAYAGAEVIIGGDFNLEPRSVRKRPRGSELVLHTRGEKAAGNYVHTTHAHAYDFWLVSRAAISDNDATVHVNTRVPLASDHAAIVLAR